MDAVRGAKFTKLAREIIVAARDGGGNPDTNLRLRFAMQQARDNSMPADKIKNAILRGTGELEGGVFDEITYEGYAQGGVAVLVQCATDNRNRTVADIRTIFNKRGGRMGESGSVAYLFNSPQGLITISRDVTDEDTLLGMALEAGAEDVKTLEDAYEVYTSPGDLPQILDALQKAGIKALSHEITMVPTNTVTIHGKEASQVLQLIEQLEENDDVQAVFSNFDIPDDELESVLG